MKITTITLSFSFMLIFIVLALYSLYLHEKVHVAIFKHYNIDSEIEYGFGAWSTVPLTNTSSCNEQCVLAHNLTDVVGYHTTPFLILIGVGIFFMLIKE